MVWQRWGTSTGTHTSGFHEEFERSLNRRRSTKVPEIWLFFKKVPEDRLNDPGEQLRQVLAFRKLQEEQRELLYQEFADVTEWSHKIHDFLAEHLVRLNQTNASPEPENSTPPQAGAEQQVTPATSAKADEHAKQQINRMLSLFQTNTQARPNEFQVTDAVSLLDIARLHLFSTSWISRTYSRDILGNHEINLLYQFKEHLQLFQAERILLIRTVIGNSEGVAPGWFWFSTSSREYLLFILATFAYTEYNAEVRKRAIRLLAAAKRLPDWRIFDIKAFMSKLLEDDPHEASSYFSQTGGLPEMAVLATLNTPESEKARLCILARYKPNEVIAALLNYQLPPPELAVNALRAKASTLSAESLSSALLSQSAAIRLLAFSELKRRGSITRAQATASLEDASATIRALAIEWLIDEGENVEPEKIRNLIRKDETMPWAEVQSAPFEPDELVTKALSRLPQEDLEKLVDWSSIEGSIAYRALGDSHFGSVGDVIRTDLRTQFSRIRQLWVSQVQSMGPMGEQFIEKLDKYKSFIQTQFATSALLVLAKHGTNDDRPLIIPYLNSTNYLTSSAAIDALRHLGTSEDSETLLDIALSGAALVREAAASAAVCLVPGIRGPAKALLRSDDVRLVRIGLRSLESERLSLVSKEVEKLLVHPQDPIRESALAFLVQKGKKHYLETLLTRYQSRESYFYNIVAHLDKVVYAPEPFRSFFKRALGEKMKSL